jgi:hypothetical protein
MPMVFPASPTVGQVFSSGGRSWIWTGTTWDSPSLAGIPAEYITSGVLNKGRFPAGTVVNVQYYTNTSASNGNNTSFADLNSSLRLVYSPVQSNSVIYIMASMSFLNEALYAHSIRLLKDGGTVPDALEPKIMSNVSGWTMYQGSFQFRDSSAHPAVTNITYSFQTRVSRGNWYYNYNTELGVATSMYTILEVAT